MLRMKKKIIRKKRKRKIEVFGFFFLSHPHVTLNQLFFQLKKIVPIPRFDSNEGTYKLIELLWQNQKYGNFKRLIRCTTNPHRIYCYRIYIKSPI